MFIGIIISVITFGVIFIILTNYNKKMTSIEEKVFYIISVSIIILLNLIYYIDRFNIPSLLKWSDNVYPQNWLNYIITIFSALLSQVISGLVLFFITRMQIEANNKANSERDKEQRRINNLPLLEYKISNEITNSNVINSNRYYLDSKFSEGIEIYIPIQIKNIGLNAIRKCFISISGTVLSNKKHVQLDEQGTLGKNQSKIIFFLITLPMNNNNNNEFIINVYYEDLLCNWYSQKIELNITVTNYFDDNSNNYNIYKYKVYDEISINKPNIKPNCKKY